jgi:hypothetical protein
MNKGPNDDFLMDAQRYHAFLAEAGPLWAAFVGFAFQIGPMVRKGERSDRMIRELLKAMHLFIENRLGTIESASLPLITEGELRRAALKERLKKDGAEKVFEDFLLALDDKTIKAMRIAGMDSLRALLERGPRWIATARDIGPIRCRQIKRELARLGFTFEASQEEIDEVFEEAD